MPAFNEKQFDENFYVLRDPDRRGVIVMGPPGEELGADMIELDEAFRQGALWFLLDAGTGQTIDKGFDRGDCDYPTPDTGERLCLASADPFDFDAATLTLCSMQLKTTIWRTPYLATPRAGRWIL